MGVLDVARAHQQRRQALARRTAARVARLWARVDRRDIARSWAATLPAVLAIVGVAQAQAAGSADTYLDALLAEQDLDEGTDAVVAADALADVASDGRALDTLMYQPAISALTAIQNGATVPRALAVGRFTTDLITHTQVADAGRVADEIALCTRSRLAGYTRVLSMPSCSRCVVLAGKFYAWNAGFRRHPKCDCQHVATVSAEAAQPLTTRPRTYFNSLSREEQDRTFTAAGAEAIRAGADIAQVVNARKGARGLTPAGARITAAEAQALRDGRTRGRLQTVNVFGQDLFITNQGTTVRGLAGIRLGARENGTRKPGSRYRSAKAPRLMPETIFQIAGSDRAEAVRLLRRNGYLL